MDDNEDDTDNGQNIRQQYRNNDMRDVRQDYPNMYDRLHKEEFGYRKGQDLSYEASR